MMGAKGQADESSRPAEPSHPHKKAEDMTAPETFTVSSERPLTTGRRPDRTGVRAKATIPLRARNTPHCPKEPEPAASLIAQGVYNARYTIDARDKSDYVAVAGNYRSNKEPRWRGNQCQMEPRRRGQNGIGRRENDVCQNLPFLRGSLFRFSIGGFSSLQVQGRVDQRSRWGNFGKVRASAEMEGCKR